MYIHIHIYIPLPINACVHMLIIKPRPNSNRFMQLEEPKISKYREGCALILYKYISSVLFYIFSAVSYAYTYIYRLI